MFFDLYSLSIIAKTSKSTPSTKGEREIEIERGSPNQFAFDAVVENEIPAYKL
jgi:hypothetical protein